MVDQTVGMLLIYIIFQVIITFNNIGSVVLQYEMYYVMIN